MGPEIGTLAGMGVKSEVPASPNLLTSRISLGVSTALALLPPEEGTGEN